MSSMREKLYQVFTRIFRREIIRDGFRGVLGRDPEAEALDAYAGSFKGLGADGLIKELVESDELWEKIEIRKASEGKMAKWVAWMRSS